MRDECVAMYGPVVDGAPQWEVRRVGRRWVVSYKGGPVRLSYESADEALEWARTWEAAVAGKEGDHDE